MVSQFEEPAPPPGEPEPEPPPEELEPPPPPPPLEKPEPPPPLLEKPELRPEEPVLLDVIEPREEPELLE